MIVEIFIRDIEVDASIRWLESSLGRLVEIDVSDDIHYLRTEHEETRVVVTPHMEDGPFLGLYVNGPKPPWESSTQLAVTCAEELGKTVRWCEENTNRWMEKTNRQPPIAIESLD